MYNVITRNAYNPLHGALPRPSNRGYIFRGVLIYVDFPLFYFFDFYEFFRFENFNEINLSVTPCNLIDVYVE